MAFNLNALKGLFSKLKPAAKTIANYGDDVAGVVANYGDDTAKALTTYGDDAMRFANDVDEHLKPYHLYDSIVQNGANPDKLDKLLGTTKYSDVFNGKASHDGLFSLSPPDGGNVAAATTRMPSVAEDLYNASVHPYWSSSELDLSKLQHNVDDLVGTPYKYKGGTVVVSGDGTGRYGYDAVPDYDLLERTIGGDRHPDWTVEIGADGVLHTIRKDELAELASLEQLDPDAYKSGLDSTPDLRSTHINLLDFPGYNPQLVGSFTYPDGFYDPDGAAMYYDSLERGYVPEEYGYVDYFSHAEPAYHPVHGQVRKRIDHQVSNRITHNTHAPAKTSMDVNNPVHRGILDDYYEALSNYPKTITPRDPVFLSKYPYQYHYPWEYGY